MFRADAVAGIFDALEFLDRRLLDLADDTAERKVAVQLDAGLRDRLERDQQAGEAALHVAGTEPPDPTVAKDAFGAEAFADQMRLVAAVGGVHVAGEEKIAPVAASRQVPDRVGSAFVDELM